MGVTALDPNTALLVIDLQQGIVGMRLAHDIGAVVRNASALAAAFRRSALPVVLVTVVARPAGRTEQAALRAPFPPGFADLIPDMAAQPGDVLIQKRSAGAFTHTALDATLKGLGVTQVVIAGVSTSMGVESTARQAFELGYNVTLPVDAMADANAETHANSIGRIFPRLGETGTTREIIDMLERREV